MIGNNFDHAMRHDYGPTPSTNNSYDDMIIESQNIDTSTLGLDPLLWLGYIPEYALENFELPREESPSG